MKGMTLGKLLNLSVLGAFICKSQIIIVLILLCNYKQQLINLCHVLTKQCLQQSKLLVLAFTELTVENPVILLSEV